MKRIYIVLATLALACSTLIAAEPALPAVPDVLAPLKAKVSNGWYSFKGLYLNFRADLPVTEEQWKAIAGLGVKGIGTGGKGINDQAIARLATMDLEALSLDGAGSITDACCQDLAKMKSLRRLSMGHMLQKEFTGKDLNLLKDLPALEALTLAGSATGDDAMAAIGQLTQLKELANWHTRHSDPRNPYLLKLTNLESLMLGRNSNSHDGKTYSALTDVTMDTLAQMKTLEKIELHDFRPSLAALEKLKALPNLKTLNLGSLVDIPSQDVEKLRAEMPGVKVDWKPLTEADRKRLDESLKNDSTASLR
jgi:hypothetical protein